MTICPSHRAKLGIVSNRSCSIRGWVPDHGKEKESGQKVKEDWGKRDLHEIILRGTGSLVKVGSGEFYISLVVYPNISKVIDGSLTLLFVLIKVYVERERGNRRLRARCLTYFCYDILISIMISTLAAVRDLAHWEPASVRFVNTNSGTEPHFLLPWLRAIFHSLQTALACC